MSSLKSRTALAIGAFVVAGTALAGATVEGRIAAYLVATDADGAEIVIPATVAEPGEVMEYRLTFVNSGESAVSGLQVVDSIPENTTFVGGSASSEARARFEVSIDGGDSFEGEPVTRIETRADGTRETIVVPPSQYTHVRWAVEDALPGEGGAQRYAYRVTVD